MARTTQRNTRWLATCLIFLVGLIFILYNFDIQAILSINIRPNFHSFINYVANTKDLEGAETTGSRTCETVDEMTHGHWMRKNHLTRYEIEERRRLDIETRLAMDWPALLYRNDSRCGTDYPLQDYRLLAQCDSESDEPCCNHTTGRCGLGSEFCKCSQCTDQRKFMPAELGDWTPDSCRMKSIGQKGACGLLHGHNISLTFLGDSLMRQFHTMMLLLLTNDYLEGSIPIEASYDQKKLCRGEQQITNKKCSVEIVSKTTEELPAGSVCEGECQLKVDLVQDYHRYLIPDVSNKLKSVLGMKNHWVIAGVGLHYQLDFNLMKKEYLDKAWDILRTSSNGWPKLIWVGIHGIYGFLRMQTGPKNDKIEQFNQRVNKYWKQKNVTVIETFDMSKGLRSYDGRHYGFGFNQLKVNVLLNFLHEQYKQK